MSTPNTSVGLEAARRIREENRTYGIEPTFRAVVEYGSTRFESNTSYHRSHAEAALEDELASARRLGTKPLRYGVQTATKGNTRGLLWGPLEA